MRCTSAVVVDEAQVSDARGRRRAGGLAILAVAALILAGAVTWALTDRALLPAGNEHGLYRPVGQTILIDSGIGTQDGDHTVQVRSIRPRIVSDSADAAVDVVALDRSRFDQVDPATLAAFRRGPTPDNVIRRLYVRVLLRQPGTVDIRGADIAYRDGIRFGWQHSGTHIIVQSRG